MTEARELTDLQRALVQRLQTLAEDARTRGELAECERLYREALHFLELVVDANNVEIAKTIYKLAEVLQARDNRAESATMIRRARQIIRHQAKQKLSPRKSLINSCALTS